MIRGFQLQSIYIDRSRLDNHIQPGHVGTLNFNMPFHSFPTINLILLFVATVSVVDASPDSFTPGAIIVTGNIKGAGRSSTIYQARLAITASCVYAAAYTAQRVVMLKHVDALSLTDAWTDEYTKLSPDKGGANGIDSKCSSFIQLVCRWDERWC